MRASPGMALGLAALFLLSLIPASEANPNVPYCEGSVAGTSQERIIRPDICEQATGRVFPEALQAKDFVSFYEFEEGMWYLDETYSDWMEIVDIGASAGIPDATGTIHPSPVYIIEVSNELSPVPKEQKQQLFFMLSIHGNEKGGREGGFRIVEDFVKNTAMAEWPVQNGAGMPVPVDKPTGGEVETYYDYLDFMRLIFIFPNPDGWLHDEAEFITQECANYFPTGFCRTNGNGFDLNRQAPTLGWQRINEGANRLPVSQPEAEASYNYMVENYQNVDYAIDIHGMLNHENFVAIMMPAGSFTPQEMLRSTRLAEDLKARLNNDEHFDAWTQVLGTAWETTETASGTVLQPAGGATCDMVDLCILPDSTSGAAGAVGSSEFADWSTVWDAIGYTDSGFHGDFFAQDTGLNAPGYDIELAYNHITVDSQYEGAGAQFNDYHVHAMRQIVASFMDAAALDVQVSIETGGSRTLYVEPTYVATNLDDESPTPGGWADENPADDHWQYTGDGPIAATPATFWEELRPFVRSGDQPGVLVGAAASSIDDERLQGFDNLVVPGSAIKDLEAVPGSIASIQAWIEAGGNLVLTDEALRYFDVAGITEGAVQMHTQYAGAIELDRDHEMNADVRGVARQTYEPVPVGFQAGIHSPNWYLDASAFSDIGGDVAGTTVAGRCVEEDPTGLTCTSREQPNGVSLGRIDQGSGRIQFIGALLPDPTEEFYHPYGLDDYATTYSGNQILRNMLGWTEVFDAPPVVLTEEGEVVESANERPDDVDAAEAGTGDDQDTPALPVLLVFAALLVAALARRRP